MRLRRHRPKGTRRSPALGDARLSLSSPYVSAHSYGNAEFRIGDRPIGPEHPCYVIAEAGSNHNRDRDTAFRLIDVAAEAGADAVKFETYTAEGLDSRRTPDTRDLKDQGLVGEQRDGVGVDQAGGDPGTARGPRRPCAKCRDRVLLDALPGGGGGSARGDWRSRIQDRVIRGESPSCSSRARHVRAGHC